MNKKLSLLIVAAMVSVAATAGTKIYVCGTKITGTTSFSYGNGTVNYDNTTRVLTLNNITYTKSGSSNNGISVDEVDGALTINFTGTNSMTISDADVVLCKSKKLTTINITGATTWLCKSGSHAALKLQDGDVRVEGSGHLYIRHNSGVAVKGGAGTENLTMAITDCEIQSTKQDIYNLKKVAFYWSSYSGRDWYWQGLTYQSRIVLKSYNTTSYAHISSVPTITMNGSMGIKEPSIEVTQNLTAPSNRTKEYIITDAKNDPNKKTDGSFVYEDNGTTARLLGPTADHRFSNPTSIEIPGYVTLNGSLKNVIVGQRACSGMETVKTVTCKYGVTQLEQNAFGYMDALKQVNLPSSLQNIDYAVFTESGTSALNIYWATLNPSNVTINSDAFSYMNYTPTLYLPTLAAIEKGNSLTSLTTKCSISSTATPATSCDFRDNSNNGPFYIATAAPSGSTYGAVAVVGGTPSTLTLPASITNPNVSSQNFYVTSIAERAFENNTSVTTANLNNGRLTTIGRRAFYNNSLSSLTTAAATIGDYAFYKGALSSVTLAEGVKTIGAYAFYQGTGVDRLTIPSTVTSIGTGAFTLWSSLRWLTWNAASVSDFTATTAPFAGLGITSFSFGSTVTKIPAYLCYNLTGITSVTIPQSVTTVGTGAFAGCTGLKTVNWNAASVSDFSATTAPFAGLGITTFNFGSTVTKIPALLCYHLTGITSLTIPQSVSTVGTAAFAGCLGLKTVYWNAASVGDFTITTAPFSGLGITSFRFGDTVTKIPAYLCCDLTGITSVTIPQGVTSMGTGAFSGCSGIPTVTIPQGVTTMGAGVFAGCTGLKGVNWNAASVSDFAVADRPFPDSPITIFNFSHTVTKIPANLCRNLTDLATVYIPQSVTRIGNSAFYNCSSLETITTSITAPQEVEYGSLGGIFENVDKFNCKVNIPSGTLALYANTEPWDEFFHLIDPAMKRGDVNLDGEVSIADVTTLVNISMEGKNYLWSDVNGDGETSIADITMLVNMLLTDD